MAQSSYPFDGQATSESQYSQFFRELQDSGIADSAGSGALQVSPGSSGLTVDVQPGFAVVRGHAFVSTAVETIELSAADAATYRNDGIVLRLDPTANSITIAVVESPPGQGFIGTTETDTDVFELVLGVVTIPANATSVTSDQITDTRPFVGSRIRAWATITRPSSPRLAQIGYNTTTGVWEFWNGVAWAALAPTIKWSDLTGRPVTFPPDPHSHPVTWNSVDNKPEQFDPIPHRHPWHGIDNKPEQFDPTPHRHPWHGIDNKPEVFPPSPHSHGQYLTSDDTIGWANGSRRPHNNAASGSGTWYAVWVEGDGKFARNTSSIRFKENVRDFDVDTAAVMELCPVIYDRKDKVDDETGEIVKGRTNEIGLIAEEVERHLPWLVTYLDGQVDGLRYDLLGVALIPVVQEQTRRIERLEEAVEALMERLVS
jgi:hypothetical protein